MYNRFGSGHLMAAEAARKGCQAIWPDLVYQMTDSIRYTNPWGHRIYENVYPKAVKYWPESWDLIYFEKGPFVLVPRLFKLFDSINYRKVLRLFREFRPDVLISSHPFCASVASIAKEQAYPDLALVSIWTDFHLHRLFIQPNVDLFVVAHAELKREAIRQGADPAKVVDIGIPVDPKFAVDIDRTEARRSLGADPHLFTVTVVAGAFGVGRFDLMVKALREVPRPFQVLAVCGHNSAARQSLLKMDSSAANPLHVFGFVDNMEVFLAASDVVITKPGGLSASECMAMHVPMIVVDPMPGQEIGNVRFLKKAGVADVAVSSQDIQRVLTAYLDDPSRLERCRRQCRIFGRPRSALVLAELIRDRFCRAYPVISHGCDGPRCEQGEERGGGRGNGAPR